MKVIFYDASELQIQSASVGADGALQVKILASVSTQEQVKEIFSDEAKTKKILIMETGKTIGAYENYTQLDAIKVHTAGILETFLYKTGETPGEILAKLQADNAILKEQNEMLTQCILEMSEVVYQ